MARNPNQAESEDSVGGFFTVCIDQIMRMILDGAEASELIVYLVLARGKGGKHYSTWGANACGKYTMLTSHKAANSIEWLVTNGYIQLLNEENPKSNRPKWLLPEGTFETCIPLSNALIDGVGRGKANPPMKRLYELKMGMRGGIGATRRDTLVVLLCLYRQHQIADYGGVNPASGLFRRWIPSLDSGGFNTRKIEGTEFALYEIIGSGDTVFRKFANESLPYVIDSDERYVRFWDAFENLKKLNWVYETTQIWTKDPSVDARAEPLYTLYVHDKQAREHDPYISSQIHSLGFRTGTMDGYEEFFNVEDGGTNIINTGRFRYLGMMNSTSCPIGIYRLKFRPHTRDTAKGLAEDRRRCSEWIEFLKFLSASL